MITKAAIVRPARLEGLYPAIQFIPANSKDHLIEVAMGFKTNPIYRQEKFITLWHILQTEPEQV